MVLRRRLVQLAFLLLTLVGVFYYRAHAERWCPFGGVEAAYMYFKQGNLLCSLGVSNFYVLGAVLLLALLARRVFCGYACPIGTISEWLQAGARRLRVRPLQVPARLDRVLSLLKYAVLAVILYYTIQVGELVFRGYDPCYALISRHGEDIAIWAYLISGAIALASLLLLVPFCRWLCPLAAVFAPFSRFGLTRVQRHTEFCTDCGKCGRACPMAIPVDKVLQVSAARCTSCLDCVAACPIGPGRPATQKVGGLALTWGRPGLKTRPWSQAVAIGLLLVCLGGAVAATIWIPLPSFVRTYGTPPVQTESVRLTVNGVRCRHSTELFVEHLMRQDDLVSGYLRVEAWPAPGGGEVLITFDAAHTDAAAIKEAIVGPVFDEAAGRWQPSPYRIAGYDPLADGN
jgi:hypothetical protein